MGESLVALQFPGQGSQRVGMGRELCERSAAAAAVFGRADEVLGFPLSRLCFEGPAETLGDTTNTQPAVLTASVAALRALEERAGRPAFVAGHSLGEFSALVAAGALEFEQVLVLVRRRGELMKEAGERNPGGMAAVIGLEVAQAEEVCARVCDAANATAGGSDSGDGTADGRYVGISCYNGPGQVVISGDEETLQAGMAAMEAAGARRVVRLAISIAAHSPLMAEVSTAFGRLLEAAAIRQPEVPIVANATARPLTDPGQIREALGRQLVSPVYWLDSVRWMIGQGVARFVEAGPGDVLTGLVRRIDRGVVRLSTEQALGEA
jgi:[acyl-carrier-protein] S-malonyltransferase